ncbi:MAG: 23S rRNA (uracil(1939)-C(5))-methyltransferase RlmD [Saccharofermentanaceae bacterium]|nr:23S rRNA (uracil(1939)-C(5))-methyltransferase RlmD [Saccharofermentanaceae bacterium]
MGIFDNTRVFNGRCVGISNEGAGVVRIEEKGAKEDGMKIFVADMLPGEKGKVRITEKKNNMTYGEKAGDVAPSKSRVQPICPEFPKCGGCQILHARYESQLQMKESMVRNCLVRMGRFPEDEIRACMERILPSQDQFYYRNQIQYPVEYSREKRCVNIGLYERGSHKIVEHQKCFLADPAAEIVRKVSQIFFSSLSNMEAAKALRQVVVRTGLMSKEMMVIFVISKQVTFDVEEFVTSCNEALKEAKNGMRLISIWTEERPEGIKWKNPKGVWTNIWGETTIREFLANRVFRISPDSFFQVNTKQAVVLYDKVKEYLRYDGFLPRVLLDLYCGTGSIGIYCSDACHHLIGIESVESAVIDARNNARSNFIEDTEFIFGKAEDYDFGGMMPDAVVIDPPRKGCDEKLLTKLLDLGPTRIVYVSCNPATLARDLQRLFQLQQGSGVKYGIKKICPVDMFPGTTHVETVVLLSKENISTKHVRVEFNLEEMDMSGFKVGATYEEIIAWVQKKYGFHVTHLNIAQVKRKYGIIERQNYNFPKTDGSRQPQCTPEKERAIVDALQHYKMIV